MSAMSHEARPDRARKRALVRKGCLILDPTPAPRQRLAVRPAYIPVHCYILLLRTLLISLLSGLHVFTWMFVRPVDATDY